jgi:hypothetical protein
VINPHQHVHSVQQDSGVPKKEQKWLAQTHLNHVAPKKPNLRVPLIAQNIVVPVTKGPDPDAF